MKCENGQEMESSNCENRNEKSRARFSLESVKFFPELKEKE